jgi:hypothetical protein
VIDGQHMKAMLRGDISELPCLIIERRELQHSDAQLPNRVAEEAESRVTQPCRLERIDFRRVDKFELVKFLTTA